MAEPRVIKTYERNGKELGTLIERVSKDFDIQSGKFVVKRYREFETNMGEFDAVELVRELSPREKIHMKTSAYPVFRLLQHFRINPDDYVEDADIAIYVANERYRNLSDLSHGDHRAYELVKQRGLEKKLFPELQEAD